MQQRGSCHYSRGLSSVNVLTAFICEHSLILAFAPSAWSAGTSFRGDCIN